MSIRRSLSFHFESNLSIVITFYSRSCGGQETAKGPFGFRVKLPLVHLSTTQCGGFTLPFLMLNVKQESCLTSCYGLLYGLTRPVPGIEPRSMVLVADFLSI